MHTDKPTTRAQRIALRNQQIKARFKQLTDEHPQWRLDAYLNSMEQEFLPLSRTTIYKIITGHYG